MSVGDFITAYTLDWGNEVGLLDECPTLLAYMKRMYDRPKAAMRIKDALASLGCGLDSEGADAAVHQQLAAHHEAGLVGGQEDRGLRELERRAHAADRNHFRI